MLPRVNMVTTSIAVCLQGLKDVVSFEFPGYTTFVQGCKLSQKIASLLQMQTQGRPCNAHWIPRLSQLFAGLQGIQMTNAPS